MDYNQLKNFNGIQTKINIALINWDPIDIQNSGEFAHNVYLEYSRYVPDILKVIKNKDKLQKLIWAIATDITGFDEKNEKLSDEVKNLVDILISIYENDRA